MVTDQDVPAELDIAILNSNGIAYTGSHPPGCLTIGEG